MALLFPRAKLILSLALNFNIIQNKLKTSLLTKAQKLIWFRGKISQRPSKRQNRLGVRKSLSQLCRVSSLCSIHRRKRFFSRGQRDGPSRRPLLPSLKTDQSPAPTWEGTSLLPGAIPDLHMSHSLKHVCTHKKIKC